MEQAKRLGKSMQNEMISRIYSSDLKRAHWTAIQVWQHNHGWKSPDTAPNHSSSPTKVPESPAQMAGPSSPSTTSANAESIDIMSEAANPPPSATGLGAPITTPLLREQHFGDLEGYAALVCA